MAYVTVHVPATTANLGSGFDCLGIALSLANRVTVARSRLTSEQPMVTEAANLFFKKTDITPFEIDWSIEGDVPRSRGLGSSVTVRLGLLHGLNALSGAPLNKVELFELCAELEGHPDNAAPGEFGGFTVAREGQETLRCAVSQQLKFVLLIPDFEIATPDARKVLPETLDRKSAVQSCANACRVTAAFMQQRYDLLRGCFADGLHQPFRESLIPFLGKVITAGENAGALGGFLSGSGSTICCLTTQNADGVAAAMLAAAPADSKTVVTTADNDGTRLVD